MSVNVSLEMSCHACKEGRSNLQESAKLMELPFSCVHVWLGCCAGESEDEDDDEEEARPRTRRRMERAQNQVAC